MKTTLLFNEIREIYTYSSSPKNDNADSSLKEIQFKICGIPKKIGSQGKRKGP